MMFAGLGYSLALLLQVLHPSSVHGALNPAVLPCEELDEFDSADELVEDCHAFVSRGRDTLVNANAALRDVAVKRPASEEHDEAKKCGNDCRHQVRYIYLANTSLL